MHRKIETFQVAPAENFRKEEVLYRFTRSKYFKCYGNLSVISFNFVNQLKSFAAIFFFVGSWMGPWFVCYISGHQSWILLTSWPNRKPCDLPWNPDSEKLEYQYQTFWFPAFLEVLEPWIARTRWLAAQPRLRAAQRCVVVVLSDLRFNIPRTIPSAFDSGLGYF